MRSAARPVSVTPAQVAELLSKGVGAQEIVRLLVATGAWSDAGAEEIVATLATSSDGLANSSDGPEQNSIRADPDGRDQWTMLHRCS
jgi:hypothetical protein